ncbi:MAG TPA: LemA family protein [Terriglobia bacterium]|nr:LemA family protein [Terriglobia bacterium]
MTLETIIIILAVAAALVLTALILLIRSAKNLRRMNLDLDKDWLEIKLLMKQRNNEMPRLVQTCRSYMPGEKEAFQLISEARNFYQRAASIAAQAQADALMSQAVQKLSSEAERFPDLRSNHTFRQIREQLKEIEERIAERGDLFNQDTEMFNARLAHIPGRWVRGMAKAQPRTLFTISGPPPASGRP